MYFGERWMREAKKEAKRRRYAAFSKYHEAAQPDIPCAVAMQLQNTNAKVSSSGSAVKPFPNQSPTCRRFSTVVLGQAH
jgi:hypothetical protein